MSADREDAIDDGGGVGLVGNGAMDVAQMNSTEKTEEQIMLDSLSKNVTALCQAIDPTCEHGPETIKIVAWENEVRSNVKLLLTNLYDAAFQGDVVWAEQVLKLVNKLGWKKEIEERLWGRPKAK